MDSNSQPEYEMNPVVQEMNSVINQITSLVRSMDSKPWPEPEAELISFITQIISHVKSADLETRSGMESVLISNISQILSLFNSMEEEWDSKLRTLVIQLLLHVDSKAFDSYPESELILLIKQISPMVTSLVSAFQSEQKSELISLVSRMFFLLKPEPEPEWESEYESESESDPETEKPLSLCPQIQVKLENGKFHVIGAVVPLERNNQFCDRQLLDKFKLKGGEDITHFRCPGCNSEEYVNYEKAPLEVKHSLHRKHSLQLVLLDKEYKTRKCYCCDEDILGVFYYCSACDFGMNIACLEKQPLSSIDNPKWHEHKLALFPRQTSLNCNVCALADLSSPIYMCPPCDFVVHLRCLSLPRVIKISRHLHRISFTHSFDEEERWCGVCRREIDNDYGGYHCIKKGCSYGAHSKCATQSNVWDGKDLEGEPEETIEEVLEPFVRISDGIIQHFAHEHHHLRLDEDMSKDYDDNKQCQACVMPIYYGSVYSCMQCEFILHEACAYLSRKIHHPIHPHMLTLMTDKRDVIEHKFPCTTCHLHCTGFFYLCCSRECDFLLHVQCATISEPLVHESHMHPLFLTSKPGEQRRCSVCKDTPYGDTETFNCIECDFALCYGCATLPQKVRYTHDKHMLTLSYGKETSALTYWCEVCEGKINLQERFYRCDDYCCVTLHIECMFGVDFYMKQGSSFRYISRKLDVMRNNHMSRPFCETCKERCPFKIFFIFRGKIFCSLTCILGASRTRK